MIKRSIKKFLLRCINLVERLEYRDRDFDQSNIDKKIIESFPISEMVLSDKGYVPASSLHITQPYDVWFLELENGLSLDCADLHIVYDENLNEVFVNDLKIGDLVYTESGVSKVVHLENTGIPITMCDISVESFDHRYYSNGILSHNTITSSIFILWYALFNFDKNAMILANVGRTSEELMDKIKSIMKELPFFLKPGILLNNVKNVRFDNRCKISSSNTSKTSSIGFTVHLLYMDEFAHIDPSFLKEFYRSTYPTISSSKVSRIIITSTPNGQNMFWEIYTAALEKRNEYVPIRIDWWQVPGRDEAWKEREIANLGSEDFFNQEYGNHFLASSRLLLDSFTLKRLKSFEKPYVFVELSDLHDTGLDYSNLKWHPSFDPTTIREKDAPDKFYVSIDTAGGGGGRSDYSVINIFKVSPMPVSVIQDKKIYDDESDFFCLLQVGIFRSNTIDIYEIPRLVETLFGKIFDPDNVRILLEVDYKGELLYEKVLDGEILTEENFVFTKHTENATKLFPGIKMTPSRKNEFCQTSPILFRAGKIITTDVYTNFELSNFGMTQGGSFSSQIGKDDAAMTCINTNPIFSNGEFTDSVSEIYEKIPQKYKDLIDNKMAYKLAIENGLDPSTLSKEKLEEYKRKTRDTDSYDFMSGFM
jgi:hypothetical protein